MMMMKTSFTFSPKKRKSLNQRKTKRKEIHLEMILAETETERNSWNRY
jgi:hypothetical protein